MTALTMKVGPLAQAGGLTVRTLHHWDTIGLLSPSRRTAGGHREYTEDDLVRLYQVPALRGLGLGLETIAACLDAGVDPSRLIRDHLDGVEASLAALAVPLCCLLAAAGAVPWDVLLALPFALAALAAVTFVRLRPGRARPGRVAAAGDRAPVRGRGPSTPPRRTSSRPVPGPGPSPRG
ncbi:MerR family transcriptional regulator [Streptomyces sp. HU2014]|uniref:MerR family transcriptional regulator n=1 Tax=Streptomyces sp. HU2014 TaxID=2939414 RepID=UPI00200E4556|nr:MerR family transcriptional regulator [Streptomyces sp. HU2014]UQI47085.1 MerR family transcriptional regulator [Streptomyces sp. HU2014]